MISLKKLEKSKEVIFRWLHLFSIKNSIFSLATSLDEPLYEPTFSGDSLKKSEKEKRIKPL